MAIQSTLDGGKETEESVSKSPFSRKTCPACNEHIGAGEKHCTNCGRINDED
jgi:hypothetical protein